MIDFKSRDRQAVARRGTKRFSDAAIDRVRDLGNRFRDVTVAILKMGPENLLLLPI
jgi:hypothetical protein